MPGSSALSFCHSGFLTCLLLFSFYISMTSCVSLDLTELRNKVSKIKVNPRGNLWATGHFMGKKSVADSEQSPTEDESAMKALEAAMNIHRLEPSQSYRDLLKLALQMHLHAQGTHPPFPETAILMKIFNSYIQGNKK